MGRLLWIPDVLREAGLDVYEMPGCATRGRSDITVKGVVGHHTATSKAWMDGHVAALLRDGRRDLAGPLSQLGLERDGTFVVIALGRANHNGYGLWGNSSIGIEAYNSGVGEPWPAVQIDAYQRGVAALLRHEGLSSAHFKGHRETDPKRKPDPAGIDLDAFRRVVDQHLSPTPPISNPQPDEDDDDAMFFARSTTDGAVYLFEAKRYTHIHTREQLNALARAAGISATEAVLSDAQFALLTFGRTRVA